jgi:hypothetical protein
LAEIDLSAFYIGQHPLLHQLFLGKDGILDATGADPQSPQVHRELLAGSIRLGLKAFKSEHS